MFIDWKGLGRGPIYGQGGSYHSCWIEIVSTNSIALSVSLANSQIITESIFNVSMPPFILWTFVGRVDIVYVSPREEILATLRKKQEARKEPGRE